MKQLRYTLTADGPSDRSLMAVIHWTIQQHERLADMTILPQFADLRDSTIHSHTLTERLQATMQRFPCDVLFVHRDAERASREKRHHEIAEAIAALSTLCWVPVIPVRMTEAWLLIDAQAIRQAADNPHGSAKLDLPRVSTLETLPDPKVALNELLIAASEKTGRRLARFKQVSELAWRRSRVAELIDNYSPLRALEAFQAFEVHCKQVMQQWLATK